MTAVTWSLDCSQNEDYDLPIMYRAKGATDSNDLTGWTARFTIERASDGTTLVTLTETADAQGQVVVVEGVGTVPNIHIKIPRATCALLPLETLKYDLVMIDGSGTWHPFLTGPFLMKEGISV